MQLSKEFRDGTCRLRAFVLDTFRFPRLTITVELVRSGTGKKLHLRVTTFASFQFYVQCANV